MLLARLPYSVLCLKLKFLLFQFMVRNLREVSVHHIIILPVKFRKIHIENYMKMSLIHYFILQT